VGAWGEGGWAEGGPVSPEQIWGAREGRGAGRELLQGVTGFSGAAGSGASQALGCWPWPWGTGWVQAVPPPCLGPLLAVPVPTVASRGAAVLSSTLHQTGRSAARGSSCAWLTILWLLSLLQCAEQAGSEMGKGKKNHGKERERAAQGSKAAEVSKTEI